MVGAVDKHLALIGFMGAGKSKFGRELARLTGGAYGKFNAGAAKQLAELLHAVAAFAVLCVVVRRTERGPGQFEFGCRLVGG